jgi:iron complex transport system ATP-binding protein
MVEPHPFLRFRNVTVERNGVRLVDRITLEIPCGEHVAILGPNGAGKTSLLKLILRQLYPSIVPEGTGSIEVLGREVWNVWEMRSGMGVISPELDRTFPLASALPMTAFEAVLTGFLGCQLPIPDRSVSEAMRQRTSVCLALAEISDLAERKIDTLSTGELRRVMIARALVHQPRTLILDEPTAGLDVGGRRAFLRLLRELARDHVSVILVTHHVEEILPETQRILLLKQGRIFRDGPPHECLSSTVLTEVFGVPLQVNLGLDGFRSTEIRPTKHDVHQLILPANEKEPKP